MAYESKVTLLGAAKFAAAISSGDQISFSTLGVGDNNGNDLEEIDESAVGLARQVWVGAINSIDVNPDDARQFVIEAVVPQEAGGWTVREVGLFDTAGDLLVYCSFPPSYKPLVAEGSAREMLVRVIVAVQGADTINLDVAPSLIVATRDWVVENFSVATLIPGGATNQILTKASNADGDYIWRDPSTAAAIVEVIEENQTLAAAQTIINLAIAGTDNAAVYIDGVRLRENQWAANSPTTLTLGAAAAGGEKATIVQNDPLAGTEYLRVDERLGEIETEGPAAQLEAREHLGITPPEDIISAVLQLIYAVGELYITRRNGSPDTWLNFGTWQRYGTGRTLVSLDPNDPDFNALDRVGGAKTHLLSGSEMPSHTHGATATASGALVGNTDFHNAVDITAPAWNHKEPANGQAGSGNRLLYDINLGQGGNGSFNTLIRVPGHNHVVNIPSHTHAISIAAAGQNVPHNNIQPYITVNMWRRIS